MITGDGRGVGGIASQDAVVQSVGPGVQAEAEVLKEYAALEADDLQLALDDIEDGRGVAPEERELRSRVVKGALESALWRGYLGLEETELMTELENVRGAQEIAREYDPLEVRHLERTAAVLEQMIEEWQG